MSILHHLAESTRLMSRRLANDLKAIPAERQNVGPGSWARPPLVVVAECAVANAFLGDYLAKGIEPEWPKKSLEERAAILAAYDTEEQALTYLAETTDTLVSAIEGLDEATLFEEIDFVFGRKMTRYGIAEMAMTHMSYHDGQLNLIQALGGDPNMHWG